MCDCTLRCCLKETGLWILIILGSMLLLAAIVAWMCFIVNLIYPPDDKLEDLMSRVEILLNNITAV